MKQSLSLTAQELSPLLGVTVRAVQLRGREEDWPGSDTPNPKGGGLQKLYYFESLPKDIKARITETWAREEKEGKAAVSLSIDPEGARIWAKLPDRDKQLALARNDLLAAANAYKRNTNKKRVSRLTEFYAYLAPAISSRSIETLSKLGLSFDKAAGILTHITKVSIQSHYRWEANFAEAERSLGLGLIGLVRIKRESPGLGAKTMSPEMIAWARSLILTGKIKLSVIPREEDGRVITLNRKLLYRRLGNKFGKENLPSYAHFTRWINGYLLDNQVDLTAIALPSFHRAAFGLDGGSKSLDITSAGERWEVDGTRADVMLKDGRYEILVAIDIYSRDMVVEIQKNASSITVAKLYFNGMMRWGVPKEIVSDNGSIFVSEHITAACELLNIERILARKYTPDDKPHIERGIGTLTKMLFEGMTWYIGHDPKERKRIDEYSKFNQVFYCRQGEKISCDATADELRDTIENWLEKVYRQEEHRFADVKLGRSRFILDRLANSPARAAAIKNASVLEELLSPAFDRVLNNSAITWLDLEYRPAAQEDFERSVKYGKQKVIFRPNLSNVRTGTLWQAIPDGDGKYHSGDFICRLAADVSEQSLEDFRAARKSDRKRHRERKEAVKTIFAPSYERELAEMPMPKVACANFGAVEFDNQAYRDLSGYGPVPGFGSPKNSVSEGDRERIRLEIEEKEKAIEEQRLFRDRDCTEENRSGATGLSTWREIEGLSPVDQYERLVELEARGILIPKQFLTNMRYFEATPEYARLRDYFEGKRAMLAASRGV